MEDDAKEQRIARREAALTLDDWRFIHQAVQTRFEKAGSRAGEPPNSASFRGQQQRIMFFLQDKAF